MLSETSRVEAFSDGVFAIAITLLILDLHVPPPAAGRLGPALLRQWPTYVAFLLSFAFIGIMWVNHHRLFNHIRRSDNFLLFLNLLLLLGVCLVPFPTALLAAYYGRAGEQKLAAGIFNGTYFAIAIFFNLLWRHALAAGLLDAETLESAHSLTRQYAVGPLMYLVCLLLSAIHVPTSLALNVALALFFALPPHIARKRPIQMHTATK